MRSKNRRAFAAPRTTGTTLGMPASTLKARPCGKDYIGRPSWATTSGMAKAVTKSVGFEARTKASRAYADRARKSLPGGVTANVKYFDPYPIAMKRARGARVRGHHDVRHATRTRGDVRGAPLADLPPGRQVALHRVRDGGDRPRRACGASVPPAADDREVRGALPRRRRRIPREPRPVESGDGPRTPPRGGIARHAGPRAREHARAPLQRSRRDGGADPRSCGSPRLRHLGAHRAIVHRARSGVPERSSGDHRSEGHPADL